jgi:hypothetical protein
MVSDDGDIEDSRISDQAKKGPARRAAAEKLRRINIYAKAALKAKKANDARAFAEALRLGNVSENSQEWRDAWKYFYS